MLPFSPLRTWSLGLLSWLIIGGAVYCLWEGRNRHLAAQEAEIAALPIDANQVPKDQPQAIEIDQRDSSTPFFITGFALLAINFGGFLPWTLFLGRPGPGPANDLIPGRKVVVDRPDGSRLNVMHYGPETGPTLVWTHGWSLDTTSWNYQLELAKQFHMVVWDLPGLGNSHGPDNKDFSIEKLARDFAAVIETAGKGPIILIGHSIGGMTTQTFCRLFPEMLGPRVSGIVLLHTTYINPLHTALLGPIWKVIEKPVIVPLNYLNIWLAPLAFLSNMQSFLNGSLHLMTRVTSFAGKQTWRQLHHGAWLAAKAWPAVVARGNLAMLEFDERTTLKTIEIPVLVIGAKDDRMTKIEASKYIEEKIPSAALAVVDGGHLAFWENNAAVRALIQEFAERFRGADAQSLKKKVGPAATRVAK